MLEKFASWLESVAQPCFYYALFGIECPGCGMQRSFIELLSGNIYESLVLYPALLPSIVLAFLLLVHLVFKLQKGAFLLKFLFIVNALIISLHYIYKLLTH